MFRNLVSKKSNLISYVLALFISLASLIGGAMPFGIAFIGALVDQKVPIIFSFLIMIATTWFTAGSASVLRFVIAVVIFAFLKSRYKNKDQAEPKTKVALKFLISQVVSLILMLIFKVFDVALAPQMLFEILIATSFMVVFSYGLRPLLNISKISEISDNEQITAGIIIVLLVAFLARFSFLYMTVFSIVSVLVLIMLCYKNSIKLSIIYSLCIGFIYIGVSGDILIFIPLYLFVGVVTALLSRLGKKGIIIGVVFSAVYLLFLAPSKDDIYNRLGINPALMNDYNKFISNYQTELSSGEVDIPPEYYQFDLDTEILDFVNSPSVIIQRELLIGFLILLILPKSWLKKYEKLTRKIDYTREDFFIRMFSYRRVLLLGPAPIDEPKKESQEVKNEAQKTNEQKEKNKSKKKNKKKRKIIRFSAF